MMSASVALLLLKATVVLLAAFMAARALRPTSAATRHLVWLATFAALLLVPALAAWAPLRVAILPAAARHGITSSPPGQQPSADVVVTTATSRVTDAQAGVMVGAPERPSDGVRAVTPAPMADGLVTDAPGRTARPGAPSVALALLAIWAVVASAVAASLARSWFHIRRVVRRALPIETPAWLAALHEISDRLGLDSPPRLLRSEDTTVPFACGLTRPTIVLPAGSDGWAAECGRAVLLHELAHIRRRDLVGHTLARVVCAAYWFHPLVWAAAKRLDAESERACDDLALAAGVRASDYAEHLLDVVTAARSHQTPNLALAMARRIDLEERLHTILDPAQARTKPNRRQATSLVGAVALVAIVVGAVVPTASARSAELAEFAELAAPQDTRPTPVAARERGSGEPRPAAETSATGAATDAGDISPSGDDTSGAGIASPRQDEATGATLMSLAPAAGIEAPFDGEWAIRLAAAGEAGAAPGAQGNAQIVHVALRTPGLNTFYVPLARLEELTAAHFASPHPKTRFHLRRDAGTFTFDGSFDRGRGRGRFDFAPDPAFAEALVRRGIGRPTPEQQFSMARHGVDLAFVDELGAQGYALPSTDGLTNAGMSGADLEYLRAVGAAGYRLGTLGALVSLSNNGVGADFVRELAALGYRGLSTDDLRRLRNQSVSAARVRELTTDAGRQLSVEELVERRSRESTTTTTTRSRSTTPLEGRWVVHQVRGASVDLELFWTDGTNWRRWIPSSEVRGLSTGDLASPTPSPAAFRIEQDAGSFEFGGTLQGNGGRGEFRFRPDARFAGTLRSLDVVEVEEVSDHDLKNLAWGGVSAVAIREYQALGFAPLTFQNALDLAVFHVPPAYARAMQSLGVSDASTVRGAIDLRMAGVTAEYVRDLAAVGYGDLASRQLIAMRRGRVTPALIRELRQAGERDLSPEELVRRAQDRARESRRKP